MAVFVAHRADACHLRAARAVEFGGAGVGVNLHAVERKVAVAVLQPVAVRPNGVGFRAAGLAITCVDDIYLVHLAVAVPVVFAEIHFAVHGLAGFCHHIFGAHVVAFGTGVSTVVRHVAGKVNGPHNVKLHVEFAVRLVIEIVAHAAVVAVDFRAARIHHFLKLCLGAGRCHLLVGEVHEDQQGALRAFEGCGALRGAFGLYALHGLGGRYFVAPYLVHVLHAELVCFQEIRLGGSALRRGVHELRSGHEFAVLQLCVVERAVGGFAHGNAVFGGMEMEMLVAREQHGDHCSVGLRALYRHALSRTGIQQGACQADSQS